MAWEIAPTTGSKIAVTDDPAAAVLRADLVHIDVWAPMAECDDDWIDRIKVLGPHQVTEAFLLATGNPNVWFMHGLGVNNEVFDSHAAIVFDQAESRLHTVKAVPVATLGS